MTTSILLDELSLRSRAYNLLYALGDEPDTVPTLAPGRARQLVAIAQEVMAGDRHTQLHCDIAERVQPALLRYIAQGGM